MIKKLQFMKIPFLTEQELDSMIISGIETIEEAYDKDIEGLMKFKFIDNEKAIKILGYCRQVLDGEIDDLTTDDMAAIEKKIKAQTSKELVFNLPQDDDDDEEDSDKGNSI